MTKRIIASGAVAVALSLGLAACAGVDPYNPTQRAVAGGLIGAGSGAAVGALAGGGTGAAIGAGVGAAVGAVAGAVTTPPPPRTAPPAPVISPAPQQ
jgi:YMGG-like Gly-zipper